jgi:hypothetical protein
VGVSSICLTNRLDEQEEDLSGAEPHLSICYMNE